MTRSDVARFRRAWVFIEGHLGIGLLLGLFTALVAAASALEPWVLQWIFDTVQLNQPPEQVFMATMTPVGVLLALGLGREALGSVSNWLLWRVRLGVHHRLLSRTVGKLQTLPLDFHRSENVGGLLTRLDRSIASFLGAVQEIGTGVLPSLVYLSIAVAVMFRLDWRVAALVLAFAPVPPLIGLLAAREQADRERTLLQRWVHIYSRFTEVLGGILTVKSYVMEEREKRRFLNGVREANGIVLQGVRRDSAVAAARNLVGALGRVTAIGAGTWLVVRGELTVGGVVAFAGYAGGVFGPVQTLTQAYGTARRADAALDGIFNILDTPETIGDPPHPVALGDVAGHVEFAAVRFGFRPDAPVLNGVSLTVEAGTTLALVGPSGSGKTTLITLLQRLYDPWEGSISLDGRDISHVRQRELRSKIGVVLQDALLFQDTIRNNIAYGRPSASFREIVAAAEAAGVDELIRKLPHGYDTMVGERGGTLSAGERQRIAIARALLKDPPLLVLDEPTSALDVETEAAVQSALERLRKGRTCLVIAHRLSTVVRAHRIAVVSRGNVTEYGTHQELLARGGHYAKMVHIQVEGLFPGRAIQSA